MVEAYFLCAPPNLHRAWHGTCRKDANPTQKAELDSLTPPQKSFPNAFGPLSPQAVTAGHVLDNPTTVRDGTWCLFLWSDTVFIIQHEI